MFMLLTFMLQMHQYTLQVHLKDIIYVIFFFTGMFKTALMDVFILTVDQMSMWNMKGVACNDECAENYHLLNISIFQFTLLVL